MDTKKLKQELIDKIFKPIKAAGGDVFFVGGCVRDSLMGSEPHDFDITTNFTPEKLHTVFTRFSNVSKNAEQFGVTMVLVEICGKMEEVEIATFRKDTSTGRHPTVSLDATIEEDASRRDFTVNALYEDMDGNITDPTGLGVSDIKSNTLRFVGKAVDRVDEDNLRLFRFCRFMAQKGFKPNLDGLSDVIDFVKSSKDLFKDVSKERQLKELKGIFGGKFFMTKDDTTLKFMEDFGILDEIGLTPMFDEMKQTTQNPMWHAEGGEFVIKSDISKPHIVDGEQFAGEFEDAYNLGEPLPEVVEIHKFGTVYDHTIKVMQEMAKKNHDYLDMMGALCHDFGKVISARRKEKKNPEDGFYRVKDHPITGIEPAEQFCKGICMSNDDTDVIKELVLRHMEMHQLHKMKSRYGVLKLTTNPVFDRLVKLAICDGDGCCKTAVETDHKSMAQTLELPQIKECLGVEMPPRILTGDYIIQKGYKPGPTFKKALEVAHKVQIDQNISDPEILFRQVKAIVKGN